MFHFIRKQILVMMMIPLTIFIVVFTILSTFTIADDPCRFSHTRGVIDLTSLGRTDGIAKYTDRIPPTGSDYKFSYNPCKPFSQGPPCQNVAACQVSLDGTLQYALGTQESAIWSVPPGVGTGPQVSYSSGEKKVVVQLHCGADEDNQFEPLGEVSTNNYKFRLTHKCACWNGCGTGPPPPTTTPPNSAPSGISGTALLITVLFFLAFIYSNGFAAY